jgi:hypothetical protein
MNKPTNRLFDQSSPAVGHDRQALLDAEAFTAPRARIFANFRRVMGASGRSYLVSVYPIDACPDYVDAVVIATRSAGEPSPIVVWIGDAGAGGAALRANLEAARSAGACDVLVHLLAGDAAARLAAIRDLDQRH